MASKVSIWQFSLNPLTSNTSLVGAAFTSSLKFKFSSSEILITSSAITSPIRGFDGLLVVSSMNFCSLSG